MDATTPPWRLRYEVHAQSIIIYQLTNFNISTSHDIPNLPSPASELRPDAPQRRRRAASWLGRPQAACSIELHQNRQDEHVLTHRRFAQAHPGPGGQAQMHPYIIAKPRIRHTDRLSKIANSAACAALVRYSNHRRPVGQPDGGSSRLCNETPHHGSRAKMPCFSKHQQPLTFWVPCRPAPVRLSIQEHVLDTFCPFLGRTDGHA